MISVNLRCLINFCEVDVVIRSRIWLQGLNIQSDNRTACDFIIQICKKIPNIEPLMVIQKDKHFNI